MSLIITEIKNHILTITINRPEKKNALTVDMYAAMADAVKAAEEDMNVRVILFRGVDGIFTAGNDLMDFLNNPPTGEDAPVHRFLISVAKSTVPMIAAVDGPAVGIGTTLLLHCDMVIAADSTNFMMPFTSLGLVPEFGSTYLLPKIMGHARASELILSGRGFTAEEAMSYGIINKICTSAELETISTNLAQEYAAKPPAAMRKSKLLLKGDTQAVLDRIMAELEQFGIALSSPEAREAMSAFMEKRKADFSQF